MIRSIKGFAVNWASERVWLTREIEPKHQYLFDASSDWTLILGLYSTSPVDVTARDPEVDAKCFEKEAGQAAEEFLRQERGGK
jgi:hypothetical protein